MAEPPKPAAPPDWYPDPVVIVAGFTLFYPLVARPHVVLG